MIGICQRYKETFIFVLGLMTREVVCLR